VLGAELKAAGASLSVDVRPPGLSVMGDEAAITGVLINLMRNAVYAVQSAARRVVTVRARTDDAWVILTVSDTGPGIRADIMPRLFEPFVTSKPAGEGLGLGLVISAQLVHGMQGKLSVSNLDAGGACFTIELPMAVSKE
jgi:two-component system C4-dicarboxylate transport sensor histidine kinase DctB